MVSDPVTFQGSFVTHYRSYEKSFWRNYCSKQFEFLPEHGYCIVWTSNAPRLTRIRWAFSAFYSVILGSAFYYQIIGDESIWAYELPHNSVEMIFIDSIKGDVHTLIMRVVGVGALVLGLLSLFGFVKHVLKLRADHAVDDGQEL